ncbi:MULTISPECIES: TIGR01457 family HAD-type hydrolase [unclassified Gemella]|uniref:TIGR01457 family HAD-type hydrolase n=1 Tax=unclassified Gemella TaxID=2624949 RepID=UPI001C03C33F|nr:MULTISPECIES: TIGR01457 family HAD-type hydrolase [unclassified Gemella]MBU0278801.1 TIGR01457 family HAD-type hydrolase [Gemella sp. zg-1178]QWQ39351.1 TIGR01457 family HAD-type hydrolase [Gemella sp. zg-570]
MKIKKYSLYLIDLDGTMYNGNEKIKYAKEFIDYLNSNNIDYLFLTNNSTKTESDVVKKLKSLDIETSEKNIFTSSEAAALYMKKKSYKKSYLIGEDGLRETLLRNDISITNKDDAQAVVVGLDRNLTYEKLKQACFIIRNGAEFIGTNPDKLLPTEEGMAPSNGGQVKYLEYVTGVKPTVIGKPNKIIMDLAISKFNYNMEDIVMVGDNYDTDIMSGINAGIDTIHVQTGVTIKEALKAKAKQPTYSIKNLSELINNFN